MSPSWTIRAARLALTPVGWADLPDLQALKADPRVFAVMLGGVRTPVRTAEELAEDIAFWAANGCGMWVVHDAGTGVFQGIVGFMQRPDGRGIALRFAFWPHARGRGLAREAASAALQFGHERAGLARVVAAARESNVASRTVSEWSSTKRSFRTGTRWCCTKAPGQHIPQRPLRLSLKEASPQRRGAFVSEFLFAGT